MWKSLEVTATILLLSGAVHLGHSSPVESRDRVETDGELGRLLDRLELLADNLGQQLQQQQQQIHDDTSSVQLTDQLRDDGARTDEHRHDDVIGGQQRDDDDDGVDGGGGSEEARSVAEVARAQALGADQQKLFADIHNKYRRTISATNMQLVKWNEKLSALAQLWADRCAYTYGSLPFNGDDVGFNDVGQNNWAGSDVTLDVAKVVGDWYKEKDDYDSGASRCTPGKTCGRYSQLMWSSTTDIGCAVSRCTSINQLSNALFVVCYYGPPGNWLGEKPYITGASCSQCAHGQFYCNNGLCDGSCTSAGSNCECKAACQNCATQTGDCRCQCKDGSTGVDCSAPCDDLDKRCNQVNGWSPNLCRQPFQFVLDNCPKMCGICRPGKPCSRNHQNLDDWIVGVYGERDQV